METESPIWTQPELSILSRSLGDVVRVETPRQESEGTRNVSGIVRGGGCETQQRR